MIYNPFEISRVSEEELVKQVKILVNRCNENEKDAIDFTQVVLDLTDVLYIYGELYARAQKDYSLKKYTNNTTETSLAYKLKSESNEKMPISYFNNLAQEKMLDDRKKEYELQLTTTRLKLAYDATQEKINAVKKKIDSLKYEF